MTTRSDMDLPDGGKSYKLVAEGAESTVVAEYEPDHGRETAYQSEADLEEELLRILESQGYERLSAHTESELIANLRTQLEKLNDVGSPTMSGRISSTRPSPLRRRASRTRPG